MGVLNEGSDARRALTAIYFDLMYDIQPGELRMA